MLPLGEIEQRNDRALLAAGRVFGDDPLGPLEVFGGEGEACGTVDLGNGPLCCAIANDAAAAMDRQSKLAR